MSLFGCSASHTALVNAAKPTYDLRRFTRPYCLCPQGVIATLRRVSLMVSSIQVFVEAVR
jgi:hypothetical protein